MESGLVQTEEEDSSRRRRRLVARAQREGCVWLGRGGAWSCDAIACSIQNAPAPGRLRSRVRHSAKDAARPRRKSSVGDPLSPSSTGGSVASAPHKPMHPRRAPLHRPTLGAGVPRLPPDTPAAAGPIASWLQTQPRAPRGAALRVETPRRDINSHVPQGGKAFCALHRGATVPYLAHACAPRPAQQRATQPLPTLTGISERVRGETR